MITRGFRKIPCEFEEVQLGGVGSQKSKSLEKSLDGKSLEHTNAHSWMTLSSVVSKARPQTRCAGTCTTSSSRAGEYVLSVEDNTRFRLALRLQSAYCCNSSFTHLLRSAATHGCGSAHNKSINPVRRLQAITYTLTGKRAYVNN